MIKFKEFMNESKTIKVNVSDLQDQFSDGGEQEQDDFFYFIENLKQMGLKDKDWSYTDDNVIEIPAKFQKFTKSWSVSLTESKDELEVGQIWTQIKSNHENATTAQLQKRDEELADKKLKNIKPFSKVKDVIEIMSFLGKNSVDVKSSERNKTFTLDRKYILKNFRKAK